MSTGILRRIDSRLAWLAWTQVFALPLTILLCVGGLLWQTLTLTTTADLVEIRSDSLSAGRAAAKTLLSYDHRTLDRDFAAGRRVTTGTFRGEYAKTTKDLVTPNAKKYDVTVTAEVVSAAVVTAEKDRVELLLYVNQNTVSTLVKDGRLDQNRVQMTMVPVGDDWRVSQLKSL
ncbi:MAG: hypothetical protein GEV10_23375 [Streptosporangiales bacterium]|nr:hypothetical protein [Streptosporangiales bacterium]